MPRIRELFAQDLWSSTQVQWVIESKRRRRLALGQSLNAFVIDRTNWEQTHVDPLATIVTLLNQLRQGEQQHECRFQIALVNQIHWTAIDVTVSAGKTRVLVVDAADDGRGDEAATYLANHLVQTEVYYLQPELFSAPGKKEKILRAIQSDNKSCSLMTLGHIFMLSKLPVSFLLENVAFSADNKMRKISPLDLPGPLRKLYALAQDPVIFASLGQHESDKRCNGKEESLQEFFARHQKTSKGVVVYNKKETYTWKVLSMSQDEDLDSVETRHVGLAALLDYLKSSPEQRSSQFREQLMAQPLQDIVSNILNKRLAELQFKASSSGCFFFSRRSKAIRNINELLRDLSKADQSEMRDLIQTNLMHLDPQTTTKVSAVLKQFKDEERPLAESLSQKIN
jgi:hypothetical protein